MKDIRPVKNHGKKLVRVISVGILVVLIYFIGRYFIFKEVRHVLVNKIESMTKEGIRITYDSLSTGSWSGNLSVKNIEIKVGSDSTNLDSHIQASSLVIKGVKIIPLLLNHTLKISSIDLINPQIVYHRKTKLPKGDGEKKGLKNIYIGSISLSHASFSKMDSLHDTTTWVQADILIRKIDLEKKADSLTLMNVDMSISHLTIQSPKSLYRYAVQSIKFDLKAQTFTMDSIRIIPLYDKQTFMVKSGVQVDRLDAIIPYIRIKDFVVSGAPLALHSHNMEMSFHINDFRDKRYPSRAHPKNKTLPSQFVQRLPLKLYCDSLYIKDSYVLYEEFPVKGDSAGTLVFDKMNAVITGFHNDPAIKKDVTMNIFSKFMGQGDLSVKFTFPYDTTKDYSAVGSLKNFELPRANRMLTPAAKARIESGHLSNLKFHFLYNYYHSNGTLEMNYKDLKISSLYQNKHHEAAVGHFKTWLINVLVKKDRNEDKNSDDRTGKIDYERPPSTSVFNFWWKSLLSGIKSAYKLDKIPAFAQKKPNQKK